VSDARLHDAPRLLGFPQERRRQVPRRRQFAAHKCRGPLTMERREPLREVGGFAARSVARANADLVSSAAKPLDHIIA
jgi:hypothetical protein